MSGQTAYWSAPRLWEDSPVLVIGGGASLREIDWSKTRQLVHSARARTIACNDAYCLFWPDMVFFGDYRWWELHSRQLVFNSFPGLRVTAGLELLNEPRLLVMEKRPCNFLQPVESLRQPAHILPWYGNTGTTAIALAAKLGAKRIVLLGFDMALDRDGAANWYPNHKDKPKATVYPKFLRALKALTAGMAEVYPEVEIRSVGVSRASFVPQVATLEEALHG